MEISYAEMVLLCLIAVLAVIIAKQQARIRMLMFAGQKLSEALVALADNKAKITRRADGEIQVEYTGESNDTGNQA